MRKFNKMFAVGAASLFAAAAAQAQTVTFVNGSAFTGAAITGFGTTASQMGGLNVAWTFTDGTGGSGAWAALGGGVWGVSGADFGMSMQDVGTTFTQPWNVGTTKGLRSVRMNGAPGRTLFDCDWTVAGACAGPGASAGAFGTANSANGATALTLGLAPMGGAFFQYANVYGVGAFAPVGDLFEQLTLSFGGEGLTGAYSFRADTDNSLFESPPPESVVPEPSSFALLFAGLAAVGVARRRGAKKSV